MRRITRQAIDEGAGGSIASASLAGVWRRIVGVSIIVLLIGGCEPAPDVTPSPPASATSSATATVQPLPATRLASHTFIPVGESRRLSGLGLLLETIHLSDPPSVGIDGDILTAEQGGITCLRFQYREADDENDVQTLCVVSFDEVGDCSGLQPLSLDLNQIIAGENLLAGNANLLEHGQGLLYATCLNQEGAYRLQQPRIELPPLYFNTVDAMGDGPYSLGDSEAGPQRDGIVVTYSGEEIRPPWLLSVSREMQWMILNPDGSIAFNDEDCATTPSCTYDAGMVQPGDFLRISFGASQEMFEAAMEEVPEEVLDAFFQERIGVSWSEIAPLHPDAPPLAFARLATLDIMDQLLVYFDELYDLRAKGVGIGYWPYWYAQYKVPNLCFPDAAEQAVCQRIETAIMEVEAASVGVWRNDGYDLWFANFVDYREGGTYWRLSDLAPDFHLFAGVLGGVSANAAALVDDIPGTMANVMAQFAGEVGLETPVLLFLNGPPITAQTGGEFCEAEICPSDFKGAFDQGEAALNAALEHLTPEQFVGFGVALFDGSHFDIRAPIESFPGFALNRVGETGYNHPMLNIYRAR
jgi:hypothetical protein